MKNDIHTQKMDEGLFFFVFLLIPIFLYMTFVPMPYGWSTMELSAECFKHMETYMFVVGSVLLIYAIVYASRMYKKEYGTSMWSIGNNDTHIDTNKIITQTDSVDNARIVRKGKSITVYDEKNRIIYKKL